MRGKTSIEVEGVEYVVVPEMRNGMLVWRQVATNN